MDQAWLRDWSRVPNGVVHDQFQNLISYRQKTSALPETNIASENGWLEY